MSVARTQREINSAEFSEWIAYSRVEPFGEERGDLRAGIVASTIANSASSKSSKKFAPGEFMPDFSCSGRWVQQSNVDTMQQTLKTMLGGG